VRSAVDCAYSSASAGVGKNYAMLEARTRRALPATDSSWLHRAARRVRPSGCEGLERLPTLPTPTAGIVREEFDLDSALKSAVRRFCSLMSSPTQI